MESSNISAMSNDWYYASGGAQQGPVGIDDLKARHAAGQIPTDALIWREGMDNWKPWNEVPELAAAPKMLVGGAAVSPASPATNQPYTPPATNPYAGGMGIGGGLGAGGLGVKPPNYLWQSIACTLLCCLPFGVVGIVYAAKVDGLATSGNMAAAIEASNKAKFWCWMSFGFGLGVTVLAFAGGLLGAA